MLAPPAVLIEARVIDAHEGRSDRSPLSQPPVGEGRAEECVGASVRNVVERHAGVILTKVRSDCGGLFVAQSPAGALANFFEQFRSVEIVGVRHGAAPANAKLFHSSTYTRGERSPTLTSVRAGFAGSFGVRARSVTCRSPRRVLASSTRVGWRYGLSIRLPAEPRFGGVQRDMGGASADAERGRTGGASPRLDGFDAKCVASPSGHS